MAVKRQQRYLGTPLRVYDRNNRVIPVCATSRRETGSCPENFVGAAAFVEFKVRRADGKPASKSTVREVVTVVAQSEDLPAREQFVQTVPLVNGAASDLQIFGYDEKPIAKQERLLLRDQSKNSWRRFRQELFLDDDAEPFAVVEWTHRTTDIRMAVLKATASNRTK